MSETAATMDKANETKDLVAFVPRETIRIGATNPRKRFKADALGELLASVKAKGILQPLLVRPVEDPDQPQVDYELVAGERRFRCATELKLPLVPCLVRAMSAAEALELQLVENLQRNDLDPFEEAAGYEKLMELGEMDAKQLAERVNKSTRYIYQRLKLLFLPEAGRIAVLEERLGLVAARQIAALPHEEWRKEALGIVLEPKSCRDQAVQNEFHLWNRNQGIPLNAVETQQLLHLRYMRSLASAGFDTKDATLVPEMGPCTTCPRRAGNSPELFPELRGDTCTDLKCFQKKIEASHARLVADAAAKGQRVLSVTERDKVMDAEDGSMRYDSPFVPLSAQLSYSDGVNFNLKRNPSWKQALKGTDVPVVLAVDDAGKVHELVDRKLALAAAQEAKPDLFQKRATSAGSAADKAAQAKKKREARIEEIVFADLMDAIELKIVKGEKPSEVFANAFLDYAAEVIDHGYHFGEGEGPIARTLARRRFEFKETDRKSSAAALAAFRKTLNNAPTAVLALGLELMLTYSAANFLGDDGSKVFARHYKIDLKKLEESARKTVAADESAQREKEKAKTKPKAGASAKTPKAASEIKGPCRRPAKKAVAA